MHDERRDGLNVLGGGFSDTEIRARVYYIVAKSNSAPVAAYASARTTWGRRASSCADRHSTGGWR